MDEPILTQAEKAEITALVTREVERFQQLVNDELASMPLRADMNLNARDTWEAINRAGRRYAAGESVQAEPEGGARG